MASDPPQDPRQGRTYEELAEQSRTRSSQTTRLSDLCALSIMSLASVTAPPEAMPLISEKVRETIDNVRDATRRWEESELDRVMAKLDRERQRHAELQEKHNKLILAVLRYLRGDLELKTLRELLSPGPRSPKSG